LKRRSLANRHPGTALRFLHKTERQSKTISGSLSYSEALKVAREWAPLPDLTISEFMKMRKNG
jgi:hypothetical protein